MPRKPDSIRSACPASIETHAVDELERPVRQADPRRVTVDRRELRPEDVSDEPAGELDRLLEGQRSRNAVGGERLSGSWACGDPKVGVDRSLQSRRLKGDRLSEMAL
jgi:hypothetical protein